MRNEEPNKHWPSTAATAANVEIEKWLTRSVWLRERSSFIVSKNVKRLHARYT
jgi:hypothetical protein